MTRKETRALSPPIIDPRIVEVGCDVVAWGSRLATAAELPGLRKAPGTLGGEPMPNGLLRHVDEQTVVGLAAVLAAANSSGMGPSEFGRWSVLVAPCFLGRTKFERSFPEYQAEGAWGVSPHLIPGHSLHSPSGTISQALRAHGPNLGIGGTPDSARQALLIAATWLEAGWAEGLWLVETSRDPEPTGEIANTEAGDYRAQALALVGSRPGHDGPRLRVGPRGIAIEGLESDRSSMTLAGFLGRFATGGTVVDGLGTHWRADPGHPAEPARHVHFPPVTPRGDRPAPTREHS
jgi:hypothetical protein